MKRFLSAFLLTLSLAAQAGLPPTSSKASGESVYSTTFKTDFGTFKGTRSGTTLTLNSIGAGLGDSLALGGTKAASAVLDVQSTTQGVLPPRMTTAQMLAIATPATGLTIYNTDFNSLATYNGTVWTYGFGNLNVATPRTAYTPTFTGFGTVSGVSCYHSRDGEFLDLDCIFTSGSPTGVEARISLPSGLTSSSLGVLRKAGSWDTTDFAATFFYVSPLIEPSVSYITVGSQTSVGGALGKLNGDSVTSSGKVHSFFARVPIEGWSSNTSAWVQANSNPIATTTEFTAQSDISAGVSRLNVSGWVASGSIVSSVYTFPITGFTVAPNCWANSSTQGAGSVRIINVASTSSNVLIEVTGSAGAGATTTISFGCQRSGADYTAAHSPFIIGTFAGTPKVPGYTGSVDTFSVSYGDTATTVCASANGVVCPYIDGIGTQASVTHGASAGIYNLVTTKTYTKLKCMFNGQDVGNFTVGLGNSTYGTCANCNTLPFTTLRSTTGGAVDSLGTLDCKGTY